MAALLRKFHLAQGGLLLLAAQMSFARPASVADDRYPQKIVSQYAIESEVRGIAVCGAKVFAGTQEGILVFENNQWKDAQLDVKLADHSSLVCEGNSVKAQRNSPANPKQAVAIKRLKGLPFKDVLTSAESGGILWVGTSRGAAGYDGKEWQYLQGRQYLLDDRVASIALAPDGAAWLATAKGITRVEYKMMTLAEKAADFENITRERHVRYGLVSDSHLQKPGDLSTSRLASNDNDGLWTAMYIAAECYRYAATHDPEAKQFARQSLQALMFLQEVTGLPGFVARSFDKPEAPHPRYRGDHPMEWNLTADGQWRWKGDTSTDELVGHYYAYSIYYDLCADETEKAPIRKKVRLITDSIMDHDYHLVDTDGRPTTFGNWNFYDPPWMRLWPGRGLNSLEILSHLKTAYHITGDKKYQEAYLNLAWQKDYAPFTAHQKINLPGFINHSDDELAFLSYYPLLKYEDDPRLLNYYRKSLEHSWRIEKPEKNPLWNFIYARAMPPGADFNLPDAIFTLQRISLDLVRWDHQNRQRADVKFSRIRKGESKAPLPPDERTVMIWNGNPYALDTNGKVWMPTESLDNHDLPAGGLTEEASTFWLLPYWMGRYCGFISQN